MKLTIDTVLGNNATPPTNAAKAAAIVEVVRATFMAIVEAGPMGVPSGTIYAALMTQGCSLQQWEQIESLMIESGMVSKKNNVLTANEPPNARRTIGGAK